MTHRPLPSKIPWKNTSLLVQKGNYKRRTGGIWEETTPHHQKGEDRLLVSIRLLTGAEVDHASTDPQAELHRRISHAQQRRYPQQSMTTRPTKKTLFHETPLPTTISYELSNQFTPHSAECAKNSIMILAIQRILLTRLLIILRWTMVISVVCRLLKALGTKI